MERTDFRWVHNGRYAELSEVCLDNGIPIAFQPIQVEDYRRAYNVACERNHIKIEMNGTLRVIPRTSRKAYRCRMCGGYMYPDEALQGDACRGCSRMQTTRMGNAKQLDKPFRGVYRERPNDW